MDHRAPIGRAERAARRAERIARIMDYQVGRGPFRFGLDAVIGLVPGVGDAATGLVGLYFLSLASEAAAPARVRGAIIVNLAIDTAVGAVPVIGDLFDFGFRAHERNARLIRRHVDTLGPE